MYTSFMKNGLKEYDVKEDAIFEQPLIYTSFVSAAGGHEKAYMPVAEMS